MHSKPIKTSQEEEGSHGDETTEFTANPICNNTQLIDTRNNDISKTSQHQTHHCFSKWTCKRIAIIGIIGVAVVIGIVAVIIHQTYGKHKNY